MGRRLRRPFDMGVETSAFAACELEEFPMGVRPSSKPPTLEKQDLMRLLRSEVKQAGGQSSWARREHIDRTMLNRILNGRKPITKEIIRALKLCNVYAFDDD